MTRSLSAPARTICLFLAPALVVLTMAMVLWSPLPQPVRATVSDWAVLAVALFTAVALAVRAQHSLTRRRRWSWRLFAAGCLLAAMGNAALLLPGSPSSQDWLVTTTLAAMVAAVVGAALYPTRSVGRADLVRVVLDGVVIGASLLSILFGVVLAAQPELGRGAVSPAGLVLPMVDCAIVTVLITVVLRSPPADYARFLAAALGFISIGFADTALALRELVSGYVITGHPTDLGWIIGYLTIAVAVLIPGGPAATATVSAEATPSPDLAAAAETRGEDRQLLGTFTVFGCFVAAAAVLLLDENDHHHVLVHQLVVVAVVAVAARELLITRDNGRLRRGLTRQVDQRSEQLQEAAEMSDAVASSIADGILVADLQGRLTYCNGAAARLLGWEVTELVGQDLQRALYPVRADGSLGADTPRGLSESLKHGEGAAGRDLFRHRDGRLVPVDMTVSPITGRGQTRGNVVVFRDVSERDRVERMKSEFVSVVSHELRTPLTAIRGALGLMASGKLGALPPLAVPMAKIASHSTDRLSRLVEDLLDLERLQSGQYSLITTDLDGQRLARRAIDSTQPLFTSRSIEVRLEISTTGPLIVRGDGDRLEQVLVNLLSNAAKYAPVHSKVVVTVGRAATKHDGTADICFTVTDRGPGIPAPLLDSIFDRFVQANQSDTRDQGGTGLGLAISRDLAEAMRGTIKVASDPGQYTTFTVTLPASTREPAPAMAALVGGARSG